ncbi:MAG TPA: serine/threonine-protein kinase [Balneolales bacterium]|nr:serine/threonine-protein kinase [Balneolales bacterium]
MDKKEWDKIEKVIDKALTLPESERYDFIDKQCKEDKALKSEVTHLLESIVESDGWLENPNDYRSALYDDIFDESTFQEVSPIIGQDVGAYTITEELGRGGMGSVYLAERSDGAFKHKVAIKIIRGSQAIQENIIRFKQERNILASLNHPNIAKLFGGGITETGSPYMIMEYIDGVPIDQYCNQQKVSLEARIQLFKKVLEAVRHAHQNMVIHRDLKPDNILITTNGEVKILDFGISKLLEDSNEFPFPKQSNTNPLTPKYAAPEQIKHQPITTATDLYALGIIFYQLLCDNFPFDYKILSPNELESQITQKQFPAPSTKIINSGYIKPEHIKGDLDAIALKAIQKEPDCRYQVANELLADLDNYEQDFPVSARNNAFIYRNKKFLKRHKSGLAIATLVVLALFGLNFFYTVKITHERNKAELEARKEKEESHFLINLFNANNPKISGNKSISAHELLDRGAKRVVKLKNNKLKASLLLTIGKAYYELGSRGKSLSFLKQAINLTSSIYGYSSYNLATAYFELGKAQASNNYHDLAIPYFKKSINIWGQNPDIHKEKLAETYKALSNSLIHVGKVDSAVDYIHKSINIFENIPNDQDKLSDAKVVWVTILTRQKKFTKAEKLYKKMILKHTINRADSLRKSSLDTDLAFLYIGQNKHQKAIPYLKESLKIDENILGKGHSMTLRSRNNLAGTFGVLGQMDKEEQLYADNVNYSIDKYGSKHRQVCQSAMVYGMVLTYDRKFLKAEKSIRRAIGLCEDTFGKEHIWTYYTENLLAADLYFEGKEDEADEIFEKFYKKLKVSAPHFNRINKRQIQLLINTYKKVDDTYSKQISLYKELLTSTHNP